MFAVCGGLTEIAGAAAIPPDQLEFFESRIRPILIDNCYKCHSKAADRARGGLHVDSPQALITGGDSGAAIVPGDPAASRLIKAMKYTDPDMEMPPTGKLPDFVIRDFETWIRNGAPDPRGSESKRFVKPKSPKEHWSFQPVFKPIVPHINKAWHGLVQSDIDKFVFAKLPGKGLSPSPKADKVTLIRRATFNLTGLPPTIAEVDAFLVNTNANAFEKVVDRLLESDRYGEHMARQWLDVARYGDTSGGRGRRNQQFSSSFTYRDWAIKAFNDDMPFTDFVKYQIAADRFVPDMQDWNLAAMGFLTLGNRFNNNGDDIIDDRIDVVTKGFLGLTVTCARCHDHKFDPIPTADYYSLHGIFRSSTEPNEGTMLRVDTNAPVFKAFNDAIAAAESRVKQFDLQVQVRVRTKAIADTAKYLFAAYLDRQGLKDAYKNYVEEQELSGEIVGRWKNLLNARSQADDRVFGMWYAFEQFPADEMRAEGFKLYRSLRDDEEKKKGVNAKVLRQFATPPRNVGEMATLYASLVIDADKKWQSTYYNYSVAKQKPGGSRLDEPMGLEDKDAEEIRALIYDKKSPAFLMDNSRWSRLAVREIRDERELRDRKEDLEEAIENLKQTHPGSPPRPLILVNNGRGGDSRIYVKGNRRQRGDVAPRRFLEILSPDQRQYFRDGSGRKQLAEAIASEDNPLTARVFVNRIWQGQFGEGIVRTPSDFGTRCDGPSHQGLLDFLAWNFMAEGWSVKQLNKRIMMSYVWQQTSDANPRKAEIDPSNLSLWQMNRRRLDFESMRDTILYIGNTLNVMMGGPAVRLDRSPFPTRRSVYGFIDRSNIPDMLRAFDFPNPDATSGKRQFTIVPQQALFMMNSPLVLQQAINTVQRGDLKSLPNNRERIQMLYRLIYSRLPNSVELNLGLLYLANETRAPKGPLADQPPWEYGVASIDRTSGRVAQFWPIYYNNRSRRWQPGKLYPDRGYGRGMINAQGGHAPSRGRTLVRRWTAPDDMLVSIEGNLGQNGANSDGVNGFVIFSGVGVIARGSARGGQRAMNVPRLRVTAGSTVDFVIDCRGNATGDNFTWNSIIRKLDDSQNPPAPTNDTWESNRQFRGPSGRRRLYAWEKYAQVLLETNELTFIN